MAYRASFLVLLKMGPAWTCWHMFCASPGLGRSLRGDRWRRTRSWLRAVALVIVQHPLKRYWPTLQDCLIVRSHKPFRWTLSKMYLLSKPGNNTNLKQLPYMRATCLYIETLRSWLIHLLPELLPLPASSTHKKCAALGIIIFPFHVKFHSPLCKRLPRTCP